MRLQHTVVLILLEFVVRSNLQRISFTSTDVPCIFSTCGRCAERVHCCWATNYLNQESGDIEPTCVDKGQRGLVCEDVGSCPLIKEESVIPWEWIGFVTVLVLLICILFTVIKCCYAYWHRKFRNRKIKQKQNKLDSEWRSWKDKKPTKGEAGTLTTTADIEAQGLLNPLENDRSTTDEDAEVDPEYGDTKQSVQYYDDKGRPCAAPNVLTNAWQNRTVREELQFKDPEGVVKGYSIWDGADVSEGFYFGDLIGEFGERRRAERDWDFDLLEGKELKQAKTRKERRKEWVPGETPDIGLDDEEEEEEEKEPVTLPPGGRKESVVRIDPEPKIPEPLAETQEIDDEEELEEQSKPSELQKPTDDTTTTGDLISGNETLNRSESDKEMEAIKRPPTPPKPEPVVSASEGEDDGTGKKKKKGKKKKPKKGGKKLNKGNEQNEAESQHSVVPAEEPNEPKKKKGKKPKKAALTLAELRAPSVDLDTVPTSRPTTGRKSTVNFAVNNDEDAPVSRPVSTRRSTLSVNTDGTDPPTSTPRSTSTSITSTAITPRSTPRRQSTAGELKRRATIILPDEEKTEEKKDDEGPPVPVSSTRRPSMIPQLSLTTLADNNFKDEAKSPTDAGLSSEVTSAEVPPAPRHLDGPPTSAIRRKSTHSGLFKTASFAPETPRDRTPSHRELKEGSRPPSMRRQDSIKRRPSEMMQDKLFNRGGLRRDDSSVDITNMSFNALPEVSADLSGESKFKDQIRERKRLQKELEDKAKAVAAEEELSPEEKAKREAEAEEKRLAEEANHEAELAEIARQKKAQLEAFKKRKEQEEEEERQVEDVARRSNEQHDNQEETQVTDIFSQVQTMLKDQQKHKKEEEEKRKKEEADRRKEEERKRLEEEAKALEDSKIVETKEQAEARRKAEQEQRRKEERQAILNRLQEKRAREAEEAREREAAKEREEVEKKEKEEKGKERKEKKHKDRDNRDKDKGDRGDDKKKEHRHKDHSSKKEHRDRDKDKEGGREHKDRKEKKEHRDRERDPEKETNADAAEKKEKKHRSDRDKDKEGEKKEHRSKEKKEHRSDREKDGEKKERSSKKEHRDKDGREHKEKRSHREKDKKKEKENIVANIE